MRPQCSIWHQDLEQNNLASSCNSNSGFIYQIKDFDDICRLILNEANTQKANASFDENKDEVYANDETLLDLQYLCSQDHTIFSDLQKISASRVYNEVPINLNTPKDTSYKPLIIRLTDI
ncbi:hypothetical protein [Cysteiniphilum litorale]|uniref:hypothetical protein n=1 Tax=Cysteiniphilum litorale TaxID=2056700 RepID=UPI003F880FE6